MISITSLLGGFILADTFSLLIWIGPPIYREGMPGRRRPATGVALSTASPASISLVPSSRGVQMGHLHKEPAGLPDRRERLELLVRLARHVRRDPPGRLDRRHQLAVGHR